MSPSDTSRPVVLILGAGLGGLTLGALLERARVPYKIFEQSNDHAPVESTMLSLSASVMPMFEQLGLLERLKSISKVNAVYRIYDERAMLRCSLDFSKGVQEKYHYSCLMMSRQELCDILLEQIPTSKIYYNKKLVSHAEAGCGIVLRFADNMEVGGSLLVGADGCNSAVRECLYRQLDQSKGLARSDKEPPKYSSTCLVGQTKVLDPEEFSYMGDPRGNFDIVMSVSSPYMCISFPSPQNTVCWLVIQILNKETGKAQDDHRSSDWGSEAAVAMSQIEDIRKVVIPGAANKTMGFLMDATPRDLMAKIRVEEKVFHTWSSGRTVLMGDACHKMSPAGGQGAVNAMLDALVLANYIESLHANSIEAIENAFKAYKSERFVRAKQAVDGAAGIMNLITKGWLANFLCKILQSPPAWLLNVMTGDTEGYRPQVAFLPRVIDQGAVKTPYQPSLHPAPSTRQGNAV